MRVGRKKHVVAGKTSHHLWQAVAPTDYGFRDEFDTCRSARSRGTRGQARIKTAAACCDHSINKLHKLIKQPPWLTTVCGA